MPRWAPWLIGLLRRTALFLEAALLVAVREAEARRTDPEAPFLPVLFFTRLRVRPATAHAWATRSLIRIPRKIRKNKLPGGSPLGLILSLQVYNTFSARIKALGATKQPFRRYF